MSFINYFAETAEEKRKKAEDTRKNAKHLRLKWNSGEITFDEYNLEMDKIGL